MEAYYISSDEAIENAGYEDVLDFQFESVVPACCSYGCMVEPDGTCEHGFDSVLLDLGLI